MALAFRYRKNACDALPAVGEAPACAVADGPAAESALYARACFVPAEERADLPDFRSGQPNAAVDGALAGRFPEGEHEERTLRALHDVAAATGDSLAACYEGRGAAVAAAVAAAPGGRWRWTAGERADATALVLKMARERKYKDLPALARALGRRLEDVALWYYAGREKSATFPIFLSRPFSTRFG